MSVECIAKVWDRSQHSGAKLLLMLALANRSDPEGYSYPGYDDIAAKCRVKRRYAIRLVKQVEASGEIFVDHRPGRTKSNRYLIVLGLDDDEIMGRLINRLKMTSDEANEALILIKTRQGVINDDSGKGVQQTTFSTRIKCVPQATFNNEKGVLQEPKRCTTGSEKVYHRPPEPKGTVIEPLIKESEPPPPDAIEVYRSVMFLNPPRNTAGDVLKTIGGEPADLARWFDVCKAWKLRGYSPKNFEGLFEWFNQGIPTQGGNNGRASQAGIREQKTTGSAGGLTAEYLEVNKDIFDAKIASLTR